MTSPMGRKVHLSRHKGRHSLRFYPIINVGQPRGRLIEGASRISHSSFNLSLHIWVDLGLKVNLEETLQYIFLYFKAWQPVKILKCMRNILSYDQ